jgi:NADP-dependent 3-hydroxy acid dehydrogenase YdfG
LVQALVRSPFVPQSALKNLAGPSPKQNRMKGSRSIIIVGVGPFISASLARRLTFEGWSIALLSRSQDKLSTLAEQLNKQKASNAKILTKAVDAGDADALLQALEAAKEELGSVDVVCYNAARVGKVAT